MGKVDKKTPKTKAAVAKKPVKVDAKKAVPVVSPPTVFATPLTYWPSLRLQQKVNGKAAKVAAKKESSDSSDESSEDSSEEEESKAKGKKVTSPVRYFLATRSTSSIHCFLQKKGSQDCE